MSEQEKLQELANGLNGVEVDEEALELSTEIVKGDEVDVLMVTVENREEFPIFITVDESQTLCISPIWTENEVNPEKRTDMLEAMLTMNIPMPLSSFSKVGGQYMIFGALSNNATVNEIIEEVEMLSSNTLIVVEEFSEFLK